MISQTSGPEITQSMEAAKCNHLHGCLNGILPFSVKPATQQRKGVLCTAGIEGAIYLPSFEDAECHKCGLKGHSPEFAVQRALPAPYVA